MSESAVMALAAAVISECARQGIREFCVCAGARNAAWVAVLAQSRGSRIWSFPEERAAAFFALGRSLASGQPIAVVTTSGTAVAELLPATIEAYYQGIPLLLVTADRPKRFRRSGAPQAIEQAGIFGPYTKQAWDLDETESVAGTLDAWDRCGPAQLNVCFEEAGASAFQAVPSLFLDTIRQRSRSEPEVPAAGTDSFSHFWESPETLFVLLGHLPTALQPAIENFLLRLGAPVYAEATSGLRESPALAPLLIRGGDRELAMMRITRVVRIGGVPACRFWRDLENRPTVEVLSFALAGFSGLARPSQVLPLTAWRNLVLPDRDAIVPAPIPTSHESPWQRLPQSEPALMRALSQIIPEKSLVFLGNSLPIREWNRFASTEPRGLRCFANRGANGIDGCIATFLGLSADEPESWCVVGDLASLYDLAAPWILPQLPPARRRIVVVNNGGGRIFRRLPALQHLSDQAWSTMENPHDLDFAAWAKFWRLTYRRAQTGADLATTPDTGTELIELRPNADETDAFWEALE